MHRNDSSSSASLQFARRLVALDVTAANGGDPRVVGVALQRSCARVLDTLRDSMGEDGSNALLARALARTEAHHPVLKDMRRFSNGGIHLDGVGGTVETRSVAEVTEAVEALLGALVDVLGRLIGEDMAIRIIDHEGRLQNGDEARAS
jgi:hypothetical protein